VIIRDIWMRFNNFEGTIVKKTILRLLDSFFYQVPLKEHIYSTNTIYSIAAIVKEHYSNQVSSLEKCEGFYSGDWRLKKTIAF
jgi:hypothetical protein